MTDTTHDERIQLQRAAQAQAALENPLIAEALGQWEQDITTAWQTSSLNERPEVREKLRLMLEASRQFRRHLQATMETGQLIRAQVREPSMWDRVRAGISRTAQGLVPQEQLP